MEIGNRQDLSFGAAVEQPAGNGIQAMKWFWQRLSKREKVLVVASFAILLLVLGHYVLIVPYLQHREWVKSQLELQPQLLTKNLRFIDRKVEIESGLEKARAELKGLESVLLSGDTSSVSASSIQEAVQVFADKEGIQIITTRVLNPEVMGPFTKIPIQLELSGQIDQLANFIKAIESTKSLLIVSELDARSLFPAAVIARQAAVGQTAVQTLRASLIVSGFARIQTASPKKVEPDPLKEARTKEGKVPS
jgi:type II secretory pathway component PulM